MNLSEIIKDYFSDVLDVKTFLSTKETSPECGLQTLENKKEKLDLGGYCFFWNVLFLETKILNPGLSSFEVNELIKETLISSGSPEEYIREYFLCTL